MIRKGKGEGQGQGQKGKGEGQGQGQKARAKVKDEGKPLCNSFFDNHLKLKQFINQREFLVVLDVQVCVQKLQLPDQPLVIVSCNPNGNFQNVSFESVKCG
ncbi:MAG: hypothetical protein ACI4E4_10730 [Acetatifactor sp.]